MICKLLLTSIPQNCNYHNAGYTLGSIRSLSLNTFKSWGIIHHTPSFPLRRRASFLHLYYRGPLSPVRRTRRRGSKGGRVLPRIRRAAGRIRRSTNVLRARVVGVKALRSPAGIAGPGLQHGGENRAAAAVAAQDFASDGRKAARGSLCRRRRLRRSVRGCPAGCVGTRLRCVRQL